MLTEETSFCVENGLRFGRESGAFTLTSERWLPQPWPEVFAFFAERAGGTLVRGVVRHAMPGDALIERLIIRRDLLRIFTDRQTKLAERFPAR